MAKVRNSIAQYNNISVLLHWLIGLGIIFMFRGLAYNGAPEEGV